MVLGNLIFQTEVVEQRFTAVVLPHHDQQASDDRNQTEHGRMLSSNMLLRNLILLIDVTFSTPTPVLDSYVGQRQKPQTREPSGRMMKSPVSGLNALQPPSSAATINRTSAPFLLSQNA